MDNVDTSTPDDGAGSVDASTSGGDWRSGLDDATLRTIGDIDGPADMARAFAGARKELDGQKHIIGKKAAEIAADPELARLVRDHIPELAPPETPDGYQYSIPEVVQENGWDEGFETQFREMAHEHGISGSQFTALMDAYGEYQAAALTNQIEAIEQQAKESQAILRREYGREYAAKVQASEYVLERFPEHWRTALEEAGFLADVDACAALVEIGEQLQGAGGLPGDAIKGMGGGLTPAQARQEFDALMEDPKTLDILEDKGSAEAKKLKAKLAELAEIAESDGY